jgi:hypothetical protein
MSDQPSVIHRTTERLVSAWYSRYRALIIVIPVVLLIVALFLIPSSSSPAPSSATRFGTPETLPTPTSSLPESSSFTPFNDALDQPGGITQVVVLTPPTLEQAKTLATRLAVTDLRATSEGFEGVGLKVLSDGTWSYKNPSAKSPVDDKVCPLNRPCIPPTGTTLPPASKNLPTPETAGTLAKALFKDLGANASLKTVNSDQWRSRVELIFNHEIQALPEIGEVVYLDNGTVLQASGVIGTYTSTENVMVPSAKDAFEKIDSATFYPDTVAPALGSEITVVLVHRTGWKNRGADGKITYTPAWAFKDANNNMWIVTPELATPTIPTS